MCLALYLASSRPLPIIDWDPDHPAFHVIYPSETAAAVRKHFRYENVYYAGSHQGCSCAFNYEQEYESVLQLRDYLHEALATGAEIEAFACRPGKEERDVQHALVTSPEGLVLPEFYFKDRQFLVIRSGKSPEPIETRPKSFFVDEVPEVDGVSAAAG